MGSPEPTAPPDAPDLSSDDELMARSAAGDRTAFEMIVRRHRRRMVAVAGRRLRDPDRAHEAVQEALVDVFRAAARYDGRGRFLPYLYRVLLNRCRMMERSARRAGAALARFAHEAEQGEPQAGDAVDTDARRASVDRAFAALSTKHQDVILLRIFGELSVDECAAVVGVAPGTIKSRLHHAIEAMRRTVEDE